MLSVIRLLAFIFVGCLVQVACGQALDARLEEIDRRAQEIMADWNVPGMAVAIVKDDQVVFAKGYGFCILAGDEPVDADTLFVIASNSKAFVTASLSILVAEGKLKWDDRATDYLPELRLYDPVATQEITIRDLVSHRSGLGTFSGDLLWYGTTYSAAEILYRTRLLKPVTSFRNQYGYQNLMYIAAGQIVERVSGQPCADFVRERILEPLGMNRTTTSVRDFRENVASPHNESGGSLRVLPHGNVDNCWGACGLNSSVADLSRWLRMQLARGQFEGRQVLDSQQVWEMWQPSIALKISEDAARFNPTRNFLAYGLGWQLSTYQGRRVVGHGGGLDGMISQTAMMPEEKLGLVVLTNSESPVSSILRETIFDIMLDVSERKDWNAEYKERIAGRKQAERSAEEKRLAARIPDAPPTLSLEHYCGTYRCPFYGDVTISLEGGHLVLRMLPAPDFVADLEHWHYNCYSIRWRSTVNYRFPAGSVNFTIDANGQSHQLVIDQPNDDFWFYELDLRRVQE
ncbi:MAG TPA: serine hydrolase [Pirellulaceae bacterium]|nr:serine hydrolase [Pirellulaceae bacterium]HMO93046.1 serine hydrolase [Pirellulaceae bacterium]HMP69676.1 serine hydrolase [Pirellulaceae bacterium]